jgi:hypothetical protein
MIPVPATIATNPSLAREITQLYQLECGRYLSGFEMLSAIAMSRNEKLGAMIEQCVRTAS